MPAFQHPADDEKRGRRQALLASLLLHLLVVVVLMVGIPRFSRDQPALMSVPVEMLTENDLLAEQVARSEVEAVEEAPSEAATESETEEATAETEAETAVAPQAETAAAADAPQPADSQPAEATPEARPTPSVAPAAPDSLPAETVEAAPEVAAQAVFADSQLVPAAEVPPAAETAPAAEAPATPEVPATEESSAVPEETSDPVNQIPEAEVAELTPPAEEAQAEELVAAAPQQVTAAEVEPAEDLPPTPRRRPQDAPSQLQQAQAQPETQSQPEPPAEEASAEPEPEEDADPLASIFRNVEDLEPQQVQQAAAPVQADNDAVPRTSIAVQRRAAELGDLIREQVASCWRIDGGVQEARSLRIPIRVQLSSDGNVIGNPTVQERTRYDSDGYYRSAADAAVRAVLRCAPLQLPPQDYDIWRDLVLNFDPREMF